MANAKCFKAEYEEYFSALKYFACRYITDEAVVCDLLQDFFIKLWEKGEVFENKLAFKTYLYRSVRNNCLTYLRDSGRQSARIRSIVEIVEKQKCDSKLGSRNYSVYFLFGNIQLSGNIAD